MYTLRTIDVWDTLLRRKCHPDFSKLISARAIFLLFEVEVSRSGFSDHWVIYHERCRIEAELVDARSFGDGEYRVVDVLNRLLSRVLNREDVDKVAMAEWLATLEFEFELRHTYPDPSIRDCIKGFPARHTRFLSDFYMSAKQLKRLLRHHVLDGLVPEGISSCDIGLSKRSGNLFRYMHTQFEISPSEHVHIGDNLQADVEVPSQLGIKAVHFEPPEEHRMRQQRTIFFTDRMALFQYIAQEVWAETMHEAETLQGKVKSAYLLGVRTAPLLIGFMLHIAERSLIDRVENLFFFTREGEFFIQIWRSVFPDNQLAGQVLPSANLLEVSRIATFCASLQEISTNEMMRLWNLYSTQSIYALLKTLGLAPEVFFEVCQVHGLSLAEELVCPWQNKCVQELFQDPVFQALIQDKIDQDREKLLAYLRQSGWVNKPSYIGVVDVGWRGTIQDNLALLSPNALIYGYYLGLQRFLNQQPDNCRKSAFGPDANIKSTDRKLLDPVSLIEMLCNHPNGSVVGYEHGADGQISAVRMVDSTENKVFFDFVAHFQEGVLRASRSWAEYIDSHVITSEELKEPGRSIWNELITKTDQDLAQVYASLNHNEVFGVGKFVDKNIVPSPSQLIQGVFSRRIRRDIILYFRQTQWVAGIWGRRDLNLVHKLMLASAMHLARMYKHFLQSLK